MSENPDQPHDFSNTVIAIVETASHVDAVLDSLTAAGLQAEVLRGESGRSHLDADPDAGLVSKLRHLARAFGDETRILNHLDNALAKGMTVISVEVEPDQASTAGTILEQHHGKYLWRFGEWSFNRIGTGDEAGEEEGEDAGGETTPGRNRE